MKHGGCVLQRGSGDPQLADGVDGASGEERPRDTDPCGSSRGVRRTDLHARSLQHSRDPQGMQRE